MDNTPKCGVCGEPGAEIKDPSSPTGYICTPCEEEESDEQYDRAFREANGEPAEGWLGYEGD